MHEVIRVRYVHTAAVVQRVSKKVNMRITQPLNSYLLISNLGPMNGLSRLSFKRCFKFVFVWNCRLLFTNVGMHHILNECSKAYDSSIERWCAIINYFRNSFILSASDQTIYLNRNIFWNVAFSMPCQLNERSSRFDVKELVFDGKSTIWSPESLVEWTWKCLIRGCFR